MNIQKDMVLVALLALLIGGVGGYALGHGTGMYGHRGGDWEKNGEYEKGMHKMPDGSMMKNGDTTSVGKNEMGHGMHGMMVTSERDFITEMIPHHQEAVDTAKEVLARGGTTPEIKKLAENIVAAQEKEIADMKKWYATWYGEEYTNKGTYMPMMRELESLSGAELDKVFLEDMIMHHMGALMMAHSVRSHIEHTEMTTLTNAILTTQTQEIEAMRGMLEKF